MVRTGRTAPLPSSPSVPMATGTSTASTPACPQEEPMARTGVMAVTVPTALMARMVVTAPTAPAMSQVTPSSPSVRMVTGSSMAKTPVSPLAVLPARTVVTVRTASTVRTVVTVRTASTVRTDVMVVTARMQPAAPAPRSTTITTTIIPITTPSHRRSPSATITPGSSTASTPASL